MHTHLLAGFRQLYESRVQYNKSDITGWLDGMRGEVAKAIERLSHMRRAAMSVDDVAVIRGHFESAGMTDVSIGEFLTPGNDVPVAWQVRAKRPAD